MESLGRDLRTALRGLAKSKTFTARLVVPPDAVPGTYYFIAEVVTDDAIDERSS